MPEPASLWDAVRAHDDASPLLEDTPARVVRARVDAQAASLVEQGLARGEVVALCRQNDAEWGVALLALLRAGARPLLLPLETPSRERARALRAAGGGRELELEPGASGAAARLRRRGERAAPRAGAGVLLATSGSTGRPKIVARSEASLIDEARRYRDGVGLCARDRVALPLSCSHAYALGWLAGTLLVGAHARLLPPNALGGVAREMQAGATIVVLTPALARLLAQRPISEDVHPPFAALRLVMVGAGPVDRALDRAFRDRFGIALGRNYGSTETGALFAGFPPLPPFCVGSPLPGIAHRIVDEAGRATAPGVTGRIEVAGPSGDFTDMGDLGVEDELGRLTLMGRRSQSVRRGDRFVSPLEVEGVLRESPEVRDVHVRGAPGRRDGDDRLVAEVVPRDPERFRPEALLEGARQQLAGHKVPDQIRMRRSIRRGASGKVLSGPRYRLRPEAALEAARAYKRSELLFALRELSVLSALDGTREVEDVAHACGVGAEELGLALELAASLGLVADEDGEAGAPAGFDVEPFVALERLLSRSWTTREAIAQVLRDGIKTRPFERAEIDPRLPAVYTEAMHGAQARFRTLRGLRLAGRPPRRALEVSAGPGRYLEELVRRDSELRAVLAPVGRLAGPPAPALREAIAAGRARVDTNPEAGAFDLCVVSNAIHGPAPGDDLRWLLSRLSPGGRLLVDDIFLPRGTAAEEIGLDWLTHGGTSFRALDELRAKLGELGAAAEVHELDNAPLHRLVSIRLEQSSHE